MTQLAFAVFEMKFASYSLLHSPHRNDSREALFWPSVSVKTVPQPRQFLTIFASVAVTEASAAGTVVAVATGMDDMLTRVSREQLLDIGNVFSYQDDVGVEETTKRNMRIKLPHLAM